MESEIESIIVEFNNLASGIYSGTFDQFSYSIRKVHRSNDENVFKLQAAKYADMLKQRLEDLVKKTLDKQHFAKYFRELEFELFSRVNYYIQEFRHKANTM